MSAIDFSAMVDEASARLPQRRKRKKKPRSRTSRPLPLSLAHLTFSRDIQPRAPPTPASDFVPNVGAEQQISPRTLQRALEIANQPFRPTSIEDLVDDRKQTKDIFKKKSRETKDGEYLSPGVESSAGFSPASCRCFNDEFKGISWNKHKVAKEGVWYIPEIIPESKERSLLKKIYEAPSNRWVALKNRRLQSWGGYPKKEGGITPEPIPKWMQTVLSGLEARGVFGGGGGQDSPGDPHQGFKANHVLVNEYIPGQGIMAHRDGPMYCPVVAILSLGSPVRFNFYQTLSDARMNNPEIELSLEPRSLLIFSTDAYNKLFHGIAGQTADRVTNKTANMQHIQRRIGEIVSRRTRVSITIRKALVHAGG